MNRATFKKATNSHGDEIDHFPSITTPGFAPRYYKADAAFIRGVDLQFPLLPEADSTQRFLPKRNLRAGEPDHTAGTAFESAAELLTVPAVAFFGKIPPRMVLQWVKDRRVQVWQLPRHHGQFRPDFFTEVFTGKPSKKGKFLISKFDVARCFRFPWARCHTVTAETVNRSEAIRRSGMSRYDLEQLVRQDVLTRPAGRKNCYYTWQLRMLFAFPNFHEPDAQRSSELLENFGRDWTKLCEARQRFRAANFAGAVF